MRKLVLVLLTIVMVSGCTFTLPSNFVEKGQTDLSTKFMLHRRADWLKGVFGYQFGGNPSVIRGALVCDEESLMFVVLDKNLNKYISILNLKFKNDLKNISVGKFGAGRRLVAYGVSDVYTFEIAKEGGFIDKVTTYEFAVFIAGKINQDKKPFAAELEMEKEEAKAYEGSGQK